MKYFRSSGILNEPEIIKDLINQGYKVVIKNPDAQTFTKKYQVYQSTGFHELKTVVVNDKGQPIITQG